MKLKDNNSLRAVVSGFIALVLSFSLLKPAGELSAILIRRRCPEAWFSGLIVWYGDVIAVACSVIVAIAVGRHTFKRSQQ